MPPPPPSPALNAESTANKSVRRKGVTYEVEIVDTRGQTEQSPFHHSVGFDGYMLMFSLVNRKSFDLINIINDKVLDALMAEKCPRLLVGNKADIEGRQVSSQEAKALADRLGCGYAECSAKDNVNVGEHLVMWVAARYHCS